MIKVILMIFNGPEQGEFLLFITRVYVFRAIILFANGKILEKITYI